MGNENMENKRTVKQQKVQIPIVIIVLGKIAAFFSSFAAVRYLFKIFTTPINFKIPEREKTMQESAQKKMQKIPSIGKSVQTYSYGYSKKKVLLVHGWSGRGTQMVAIADSLLENREMTISFDAPAHGFSEGKQTSMLEFIEVIKEMDREHGPFEIAIGHSLGGMALLNAVAQNLQLQKLVVVSAGNSIREIIERFVADLQLRPKIAGLLKKHTDKKFGEDIEVYSGAIAAKSVAIPTLVIHDTEDKDVSVSCAYAIRQNLEKGSLLITNGLGHRRILKDKKVIHKIIEFINS